MFCLSDDRSILVLRIRQKATYVWVRGCQNGHRL